MTALLFLNRGKGIAAPQCGLNLSIYIIDGQKTDPPTIFINPTVISMSKEEFISHEGCLSFPGLEARVQRSREVTINWRDLSGGEHEETFVGLDAAAHQHEYAHLMGLTFFDQIGHVQRGLLERKFTKIRKQISNMRKIREKTGK
jgi:peptide deformylase